jgi:transposase
MLRYKAALVGIRVVVSAKRSTATCSVLDLEPIDKQEVYAGQRIKGGLFRASDGRRLNADSNGAFNILRKGVPDACGNGRGGVVHPARRTLANGPHGSHVHLA